MVRLSKKEQQDKRELLSSINQMNIAESKNVDNGELNILLQSVMGIVSGLTSVVFNFSAPKTNIQKWVPILASMTK